MKKNLILLFSVLFMAGFSTSALAAAISLPNPLCPDPLLPGCVNSFPSLIAVVTNYIATLAASLAVLMFIWAGILFLTSAGSETRLASAKRAVWWAIIGLGIALAGAAFVAVIRGVIGIGP